jgi:hypothetical protein
LNTKAPTTGLLDSNAGPEGLAALWSDRKRGRHRQNLPARAQARSAHRFANRAKRAN